MSSHRVEIRIDDRYGSRVDPAPLREAAEETLVQQSVDDECDLTVVVTGARVLRELNRRHRGVDTATDVLAFPGKAEGPFVHASGGPSYLGDVIISFPQAEAQAQAAGNTLSAELQLLVVHGILHLLGYADQTEREAAHMWAVQQAVLDQLGVRVHFRD